MKIYDISRLPNMILLGFDGENNWRPQAFDCTPLLENHPNGTITLWILPDGETQAFPVALTRDGNTVVWTPLSEEMTERTGALQIVCTDGTDVGKSRVALYRVDSSILPGADHPAAVPSWATQTVERAEDAADRAEAAAESIDIDALEAQIAQAVEDYLEEHPVSVTVDSTLSGTSENPVQNKVINAALQSKGTYSKPSGGIPASDLASGVIPAVPQMATQPDMSDWTSGKTVDAAVLKTDFSTAISVLKTDLSTAILKVNSLQVNKADKSEIPTKTSDLTNDSGFQTAAQVQTYVQQQISAIPDELPTVTASDNGKFLRVVSGAWAAQAVPSAESNSFGGGST